MICPKCHKANKKNVLLSDQTLLCKNSKCLKITTLDERRKKKGRKSK